MEVPLITRKMLIELQANCLSKLISQVVLRLLMRNALSLNSNEILNTLLFIY